MGGNVELKETESDEIKTTYVADWNTAGFEVEKRGKRKAIPIILEVREQLSISKLPTMCV